MEELFIEDKKKYLEKNYPFGKAPDLEDKVVCMHCSQEIRIGDYKVYKNEEDFEAICCPNAPECDGTIIDWVDNKHWFSDDDKITAGELARMDGNLDDEDFDDDVISEDTDWILN